MRIIKEGNLLNLEKQLECSFCGTLFVCTKKETANDLLCLYVNCPSCRRKVIFETLDFHHFGNKRGLGTGMAYSIRSSKINSNKKVNSCDCDSGIFENIMSGLFPQSDYF